MNPDIALPQPGHERARAASSGSARRPAQRTTAEAEQKKLIVGRDIFLNGEIRTCDSLVVEGKVEAVLSDCRAMDIAGSGEFRGPLKSNPPTSPAASMVISWCVSASPSAPPARCSGKIRYGQLEVERGGVISGTIEALADGAPVGTAATPGSGR